MISLAAPLLYNIDLENNITMAANVSAHRSQRVDELDLASLQLVQNLRRALHSHEIAKRATRRALRITDRESAVQRERETAGRAAHARAVLEDFFRFEARDL